MKKLTPSLIVIAVYATFHSTSSYAEIKVINSNNTTLPQCLINAPIYTKPLIDGSSNLLPIEIEADKFSINYPDIATYTGNVSVNQGNRHIESDKVTVENKNNNQIITLTGNVNYLDTLVSMQSRQVGVNIETNEVRIDDGEYHLVGRLGRGQATLLELKNERYVVLKDGSFTSCPIDDNTWSIDGSTIIHDEEKELVEIWNARFKLGSVPVFYVPYLQFPTGERPRSGLLLPSISYDSIGGFEFAQPIYWNIAPNFDMTFTPHVIQRRGLQLQTEARYLTQFGKGLLAYDWLYHDALLYNKDNLISGVGDNKQRWLFHWEHEALLDYNWRINTNTTRVSDSRYLIDLNSNYGFMTDGYLTQTYQVGYANNNWDIVLSSKNFQVFRNAAKSNLYRTEPKLDINYYYDEFESLRFNTFAQIAHFTSPDKNNPDTIRAHIAPTLSYNLLNRWASLNTQVSLLATHYDQDIPNSAMPSTLEKNVDRVMPQFSIDGKLVLEKESTLFDGYTQTLEPRIKYEYIPFRDQSKIRNYDSSLLQDDYSGLFRDFSYSGLDRIASTNHLATGLTSRYYDEDMVERFNFSVGQIYYFKESKTGDLKSSLDENKDTGSLTWAADLFWLANNDTVIRSGMQYDTRIDEIALANTVFEYKPSSDKLIQLSYRYASSNYIDAIGLIANSPYKQSISQLGIMASWPITDTVLAVGSYNYDLKLEQTVDNFIGLQYSSCCWSIGMQYGRRIIDWNSMSASSEYDNKFSFYFELLGIATKRNTSAKMLNFGLLPYQSAFE